MEPTTDDDRPMDTQPERNGNQPTPTGPMFADTEHHHDPIDERTGLRGRPESPSDRFGQQTRDNVNPNIPSALPGDGGIVDPSSLGMEQGGVEAPVVSINEPGTPATTTGPAPFTDTAAWPYVGVDPAHPLNVPVSPNEPPGSAVGGEGGGGGTPEPAVPVIEALDPDEIEIGTADTVLHVHGTGFTEESIIHFAGVDEPTTFVDETELTTGLKPSLWVDGMIVQCSVKNGDVTSDEVEFEFLDAPVADETAKKPSKRTKPAPKAKPKHKGKR